MPPVPVLLPAVPAPVPAVPVPAVPVPVPAVFIGVGSGVLEQPEMVATELIAIAQTPIH
jgi:hypothetical protein